MLVELEMGRTLVEAATDALDGDPHEAHVAAMCAKPLCSDIGRASTVTVQAQILRLLARLKRRAGAGDDRHHARLRRRRGTRGSRSRHGGRPDHRDRDDGRSARATGPSDNPRARRRRADARLARDARHDRRARRPEALRVRDASVVFARRRSRRGRAGADLEAVRGATQREIAASLLESVGLDPALGARKPWQLSGRQCQRVVIARALSAHPALLVLDEPLSALDVSVRAQLLGLLTALKDGGTAMVLISHDLSVVEQLVDRVIVMLAGGVVEHGPSARSSTIRATRSRASSSRPCRCSIRRSSAAGSRTCPTLPPRARVRDGCPYRLRCPRAVDRCSEDNPALRPAGASDVACLLVNAPRGAAPMTDATLAVDWSELMSSWDREQEGYLRTARSASARCSTRSRCS
jgi:ABC-type dipeptide/oligopeptide/nickel transport system ATPase component